MQEGLTIVIPVRNRAKLIERTLNSVIAGVQLPCALIIVDNGSDDETFEVCRRWQAAHSTLDMTISVVQEERAGAAIARNTGLSHVQTKWTYFFDSDDDFDTHFVCEVMSGMAEFKASGNESDIVFVPSRQEVNGTLQTRAYRRPLTVSVQILSAMLSTQSMLFRTQWLREIGGWDEQLTTWDDWELGVRVAKHTPHILWLTHRSFHVIHVHPDSLTGDSYASRSAAILQALRQVKNDVIHDFQGQRALYLRTQIIAGTLSKEHSDNSAFRSFALEILPSPSIWLKSLGNLIRFYTQIGGHGAWRVALMFIH